MSQKAQKLEIEDEEERQHRIESLLESLNSNSTTDPLLKPTTTANTFDFGDRTTYPVEPPTALLDRAKAFLAQLPSSSAELDHRLSVDPKAVNMEEVGEDEERVIQMELGLGVFEDRRGKANASTSDDDEEDDEDDDYDESESEGISGSEEDSSDTDSEADSKESDSSSDSDLEADEPREPRLIRPLPKRALGLGGVIRPTIEVISETITMEGVDEEGGKDGDADTMKS